MALKAISTAALSLRKWPAPGQWTYQDYLDLPDDEYRYEVICGELYMSSVPTPLHQQVLRNLQFALWEYVKRLNLGEVLFAPCDIILEVGGTPVEPDILFIAKARANIITDKNVQGAPDLIVEVLSPSNPEHDRQLKFELYQKSGVTEYWLVDPQAHTVEVFVLKEKAYLLSGRYDVDDVAKSEIVAGFSVPVRDIFPRS